MNMPKRLMTNCASGLMPPTKRSTTGWKMKSGIVSSVKPCGQKLAVIVLASHAQHGEPQGKPLMGA